MGKYIEVVTNLPVDRTFQYKLGEVHGFEPAPGKRVWVPFRSHRKIGYIVEVSEKPKVDKTREAIEIIDEEPILTPAMLDLAKWVKNNYYCSWGEAVEAMLPGPLRKGRHDMKTLNPEPREKSERTSHETLTEEQSDIFSEIKHCIDKEMPKVFLIHGVTGSGKTEIYLQAMQQVLDKGKSGVILVPEISLTPQTVERFVSRFGNKVVVLHSRMLTSVRFREWKRIASGEVKVVVGPRSAIFSPLRDPGLFIVDEEHEPSYKQEDKPRYHAREVAIERARQNNCPVLLGSATPSLESFYKAKKGEYTLTRLTKRIRQDALPKVKVVDMRMDIDMRTGKRVISKVLEEALRKELKKKYQCLVFLNRRGYSTFVMCRKCGHVMKCEQCDSPFVFHKEKGAMVCHYCDRRLAPVKICPECESDYLRYLGTGTQRVQRELERLFPGARIARMDSDTMKKRGAHTRVLNKFKAREIDILVGTQMIAKGFDFPMVTQIGVVSADANLNLPDFRSGERTFDLITQVAGRAGRGDLGGEVVVQTFSPEHYAIKLAAKQDYDAFYNHEIANRRELNFPPIKHLVKITLRGKNEQDVIKIIEKLAEKINRVSPELELLGPAPSPIAKVRGFYRWNVLLKTPSRIFAVERIKKILAGFRKKKGVVMTVDIDPMSM